MAQILEEGGQYYTSATMSSRLAYSDVGSVGDLTSYSSTPRDFHDYTASSTEVTPQHSPAAVRRTSSLPRSNRGGSSSLVMNDRDKGIYNSLGSSSSSSGKLTYSELGLTRGWKKRGIMWKTGPKPSWYSSWKKRAFVLKGNFLFYFSPHRVMNDVSVLGAIYLKNAIIEKTSLAFAKFIMKISPPVPRRKGWEETDDETGIFYIKFKTGEGRDEWYEELQQVAFNHQFPAKKGPLINSSMEYVPS